MIILMIQNIIFDFDGVLVDSEILVAEAFSRYMIESGYDFNQKEFSKFAASKFTFIKVELIAGIPSRIHPDAEAIPGFSFEESEILTGDHLNKTVSWNGNSDISKLGDSIAIRIQMFQAKLFAYSI